MVYKTITAALVIAASYFPMAGTQVYAKLCPIEEENYRLFDEAPLKPPLVPLLAPFPAPRAPRPNADVFQRLRKGLKHPRLNVDIFQRRPRITYPKLRKVPKPLELQFIELP